MGSRRRLIRIGTVALLGVSACTSCKRPTDKPPPEQKPLDHLAPNEVDEGKEKAFGLPLPRRATVAARFEKTVQVFSPLSPEALVNFVRARVKDGTITPGSGSTQMYDVTPVGDAQKRLNIEVRTFRGGDGSHSEMVIHDATPPPTEPGLTDEQRWRKAGLSPDGRVADPQHLQ